MHDELLRLPREMKVGDKLRATQGRHVSASSPPKTADKWQELSARVTTRVAVR